MSVDAGTRVPFRVWEGVFLLLLIVVYTVVAVGTWGFTYWDFGDGNYLYIAKRINEGAVLYRDILAPQPPLHLIAGSLSLKLGDALFEHAHYGVRFYSLVARIATIVLLWWLARIAFRDRLAAAMAAAIYAVLPIGFWWTLCYESENIELPLLLAAMIGIVHGSRRALIAGGVCAGLAMHCNMTALPFFLVNAIFLAFREPRKLLSFVPGALIVFVGGATWAQLATGYYLDNVLLNQAGTFPRTDILQSMGDANDSFLRYAWRKVSAEGTKVLELEGGFLLIAALALAWFCTREGSWKEGAVDRPEALRREYLAWSAIGMLLSIGFVAKGGTVNYIFMLGEPAIGLFAGYGIAVLWRAAWPGRELARTSLFHTQPFLRALFCLMPLAIALVPVGRNIGQTISEQQSELPESELLSVRSLILAHARPGDTILAPPFYAFVTDTRVAGELAENYIWQIKWMNESFDAIRYGKETGSGVAKMREVAGMLERREVAFVLLDMAQTGRVPEIAAAIDRHYEPVEPKEIFTRNTVLRTYAPKRSAAGL